MRNRFLLSALGFTALIAGASAVAAEQTKLMQTSPFLPAPGAAVAATDAPGDTLEFAGVSVGELQTLVSLFDTKERRGKWIAVGSKIDGIEVVSYDGTRDQIVIRDRTELKVLNLRRPGKVTGAPAVAPSPTVANSFVQAMVLMPTPPPPSNEPKKPLTIAQQEEEARMFVADMLDIGMQHRKAYEEAQKKAVAEKATGTATPPPAPAPVPVGG